MYYKYKGQLYDKTILDIVPDEETERPEPLFTLEEMFDCWYDSEASFSQSIGGDMSDEKEFEIPVYLNKQHYFKEKFNIDTSSI